VNQGTLPLAEHQVLQRGQREKVVFGVHGSELFIYNDALWGI
jgi:hypothetical protein